LVEQRSIGKWVFTISNYTVLAILACLCLVPFVHVIAVSFSSNTAIGAGRVFLLPVEYTSIAYRFVWEKPEFSDAFLVSLYRVMLGVPVNMFLSVLLAYPLSKESATFKWRTFYVWYFFITILMSGGLIPTFIVIKETYLINSIWALIIPSAVPVFNVILLLNFFRSLPKELNEAASLDGAGHWTTLWRVILPVSKPVLATLVLFTFVWHWNSWFDGLIYMSDLSRYPLQSYLQTTVIQPNPSLMSGANAELLKQLSDRTVKSAQLVIATLPVLLVYPFLQKYFIGGVVLGSVKE